MILIQRERVQVLPEAATKEDRILGYYGHGPARRLKIEILDVHAIYNNLDIVNEKLSISVEDTVLPGKSK